MTHSTATRRLVKSPPELWAELSSEQSLGRRLAQFGEIRITRVEPETTVAWEGDRASGTVELAPTGWGTKVILTAKPTVPPDRAPAAADDVQAAAPAPSRPAPERIALRPPPDPAPEPIALRPPPDPPPAPAPAQPPPTPRRGFLARLLRRRPSAPAPPSAGIPGPPPPAPDPSPPAPMPDPSPLPPDPDPVPPDPAPTLPEPQIELLDPGRTAAILDEVLDDLGAAHHRPFSRD